MVGVLAFCSTVQTSWIKEWLSPVGWIGDSRGSVRSRSGTAAAKVFTMATLQTERHQLVVLSRVAPQQLLLSPCEL